MEKLLFDILKMDPNGLHSFLKNYLINKGYANLKEVKQGFLYAKGDIPFMLVAHLDTVHMNLPTNIFFDQEQRVVWSPEGIGGDDRAGVYGILKVLEYCKPHILFLHEEEIGGCGAYEAIQTLNIPPVNFMIEFDRRGSDDAVFYNCGNKEFQNHILSFNFNLEYGSFSDISVLSPDWDIASVNLSIGYYNEHSTREFIKLNELDKTIERTVKILKESDPNIFYDFQEIKRKHWPISSESPGKVMTMKEFEELFGYGGSEQ